MTMPGFTAEASLNERTEPYRTSRMARHLQRTRVVPQADTVVIPPSLWCYVQYWSCNDKCSSLPIWRRNACYSYCNWFLNRCLHPVPIAGG
jgi:hypothetical protein